MTCGAWTVEMDAALLDLHRVQGKSFTHCAPILNTLFGLHLTRSACIGRYDRIRRRARETGSRWTVLQVGEAFFSTMDRRRLDNSYQYSKRRYGVGFTITKCTKYGRHGFMCRRLA